MQIEISGHHVSVTDGLRQAVHQKFEKIEKHYPDINSCQVILTVERNCQIAEITTQFLGCSIAVEARDSDLYIAIADAVTKLDAKLGHKKGALRSQRGRRSSI